MSISYQSIKEESRKISVRIPESLALDIEARAIMHGQTFSAELVETLTAAVNPICEDLPTGYRVMRERALMQERIEGHRLIIRDLRSQLEDKEEAK